MCMKKLVYFVLLIPFFSKSQSSYKKVSALFLGNSYTYVNNLPLLVRNIALANGDTLTFDGNLIGGYTLYDHFTNTTSLSKINAAPWNYLILQAQSQEPAFPPGQVASETLPFAIKLDSVYKQNNACGKTVFYETWGRKNGDAQNCAIYPAVCTYTGMQNRLKASYKLFADTTQGIMAPAGEAFRKSISTDPNLELYDPDQSHPSLAGSYLTASVFYEVLFQKSVLSNTFNPGLSATTLAFLQQVAHNTVNDSLPLWNLGVNLSWAPFTYTQTGTQSFQFQTSSPTLANKWYFGDGVTTLLADPLHNYLQAGNYTVSHVVNDGCRADSAVKFLSILATGIATGI